MGWGGYAEDIEERFTDIAHERDQNRWMAHDPVSGLLTYRRRFERDGSRRDSRDAERRQRRRHRG